MFRKTLSFFGTKIGISVLAAIAIVSFALVIKDVEFFEGKPATTLALTAEKEATRQVFEKDSDNDGLKDWEEALYGTDMNNPDTLGTGKGDAEEVKKIKESGLDGSISADGTQKEPTATDRFSRELLTRYIEAKRAGEEITPELSNDIASEVLSKSYDVAMPPFDVNTLTTVNTNDITFIRSYGNLLWRTVATPMPEGTSNELLILEQIAARESTTEKNIADLEKLVDRYTKMRDGLVKMRVPLSAKDAHGQMVQGIEILRNAVIGIKSLDLDPIGSLTKIALYEEGVNLLTASSERLRSYFTSSGLVFATEDTGDIFIR